MDLTTFTVEREDYLAVLETFKSDKEDNITEITPQNRQIDYNSVSLMTISAKAARS